MSHDVSLMVRVSKRWLLPLCYTLHVTCFSCQPQQHSAQALDYSAKAPRGTRHQVYMGSLEISPQATYTRVRKSATRYQVPGIYGIARDIATRQSYSYPQKLRVRVPRASYTWYHLVGKWHHTSSRTRGITIQEYGTYVLVHIACTSAVLGSEQHAITSNPQDYHASRPSAFHPGDGLLPAGGAFCVAFQLATARYQHATNSPRDC